MWLSIWLRYDMLKTHMAQSTCTSFRYDKNSCSTPYHYCMIWYDTSWSTPLSHKIKSMCNSDTVFFLCSGDCWTSLHEKNHQHIFKTMHASPVFFSKLQIDLLTAPYGECQGYKTSQGDISGGAKCPGWTARETMHDIPSL